MKIGDKFVIVFIIVSLLFGIFINYVLRRTQEKQLVILSDGEIFMKVPISDRTNLGPILVTSREGFLYVVVNEGKVKVIESTCKDKLCIKQGEISKVGESIVCLPNRISISIVGEDKYVDTTSY